MVDKKAPAPTDREKPQPQPKKAKFVRGVGNPDLKK